jgi:uncharacterized RDD family membrane protein YckC
MTTPGFWRRMGSVLYEALAVLALWMLASAIVTTLHDNATHGWARSLLQELSLVLIAAYFLWCWTHGGQTLAMKTWKMRVVTHDGTRLGLLQALRRFGLAALFTLAGGIGFWWALVDKDRQFLHDRLGDTRLIVAEKQD